MSSQPTHELQSSACCPNSFLQQNSAGCCRLSNEKACSAARLLTHQMSQLSTTAAMKLAVPLQVCCTCAQRKLYMHEHMYRRLEHCSCQDQPQGRVRAQHLHASDTTTNSDTPQSTAAHFKPQTHVHMLPSPAFSTMQQTAKDATTPQHAAASKTLFIFQQVRTLNTSCTVYACCSNISLLQPHTQYYFLNLGSQPSDHTVALPTGASQNVSIQIPKTSDVSSLSSPLPHPQPALPRPASAAADAGAQRSPHPALPVLQPLSSAARAPRA